MSYTVDLIVGRVDDHDQKAWEEIERLRTSYYDNPQEKAPALVTLHAALTARYPCLCSYADDDERIDECPWADGPMIDNFSHEMGMLAISLSRAEEVVPFVVEQANALGLTVADGQTGTIFRPGGTPETRAPEKPWWKFW